MSNQMSNMDTSRFLKLKHKVYTVTVTLRLYDA